MSPLVRRLGVLAISTAMLWSLGQILIPGIDGRAVESWSLRPSVGMVALQSWITAFLLVELVTAVVPRFRPARRSRTRDFWSWVVATWLVTSALHALLVASVLETARQGTLDVVVYPGLGFRLTTIATCLAGGAMVMLVSLWNHRSGLGAGLALALGLSFQPEWTFWWSRVAQAVVPALVPLVIVGSTVAAVSLRTPGRRRLVPAGILPLLWAPASLNPALTRSEGPAFEGGAAIFFVLGATVGIALLSDRAAWSRHRNDLSMAIVVNGAWLAVLLWMVQAGLAPAWGLGLIVCTAFAVDLVTEVWARHAGLTHEVGVFQRVADADGARTDLEEAGIPASLRGDHLRSLLGFLGPFLPVGLLVDVGDRERASSILASTRPTASG